MKMAAAGLEGGQAGYHWTNMGFTFELALHVGTEAKAGVMATTRQGLWAAEETPWLSIWVLILASSLGVVGPLADSVNSWVLGWWPVCV